MFGVIRDNFKIQKSLDIARKDLGIDAILPIGGNFSPMAKEWRVAARELIKSMGLNAEELAVYLAAPFAERISDPEHSKRVEKKIKLWVRSGAIREVVADYFLCELKDGGFSEVEVTNHGEQEIEENAPFYLVAYEELKNGRKDRRVWALSLSEAEGDEEKAQAIYSRRRANDLREKQELDRREKELKRQQEEYEERVRQEQIDEANRREQLEWQRSGLEYEVHDFAFKLTNMENNLRYLRFRGVTILFIVFASMLLASTVVLAILSLFIDLGVYEYIKNHVYAREFDSVALNVLFAAFKIMFMLYVLAWFITVFSYRGKAQKLRRARDATAEKYDELLQFYSENRFESRYAWQKPKSIVDSDKLRIFFFGCISILFTISVLP